MADEILRCRTIKDSNDVIVKHAVLYKLDDGAGNTKHWETEVEASEMTTPSDLAEAKTLANGKASTHKTEWVNSLTTADSEETSTQINGEVTL